MIKKQAATISHIRNENLKTIKLGYPGNKIIDGRFANGEKYYVPGFDKVLKWQLTKNPQKKQKQQDNFVPKVISDPSFMDSPHDMVVWLGHASFFIRLNGVTILTDPVFFNPPMLKRRHPLPVDPETFRNIDYILLSHGHYDHLDKKTLQLLLSNNPYTIVLAPLKLGKLLQKIYPDVKYQEAGWWQQFEIPASQGVEIFLLPAYHWFRRHLNDTNTTLWGSFMIRTPEQRVYFAGDSAYDTHYTEICAEFGGADVCLMPIGAYKPSFLMQASHMSPVEAAQAFNELYGQVFIPMHYGTFDLSDEPAGEPLRLIQQIAAAGQLKGRLLTPAVGEAVVLSQAL